MAEDEQYVRKEYIDERFLGIERRMEQGFSHAEKAREQNYAHVNQRLDDLHRRFDDLNHNVNQRFDDLNHRRQPALRRPAEYDADAVHPRRPGHFGSGGEVPFLQMTDLGL